MIEPLQQGIGYGRAYFEIHVGNPKRRQVVAPEKILHSVVFDTMRVSSVNDVVKICHGRIIE